MNPDVLGRKYDKIATWWQEQHFNSDYGSAQFEKALAFCSNKLNVLDVGCGAGGRFIHALQAHDASITGIDVSTEMVKLARKNHPDAQFYLADVSTWQTDQTFDLVYAWDSIFHLPLAMQKPVINKLCGLLNKGGVLLYTFGNAIGEETGEWLNDTFYYSSIGINENVQLLIENGLTLLHLELDQYPERHVYIIASKPE